MIARLHLRLRVIRSAIASRRRRIGARLRAAGLAIALAVSIAALAVGVGMIYVPAGVITAGLQGWLCCVFYARGSRARGRR